MGVAQSEEGLEPTKEWVKDLIDEIIAEEFASPDLELIWEDEDTDAAQAEAQLEARVKLGAVTLNEMRDSLGLDPFDNAAADRPMVLTATFGHHTTTIRYVYSSGICRRRKGSTTPRHFVR